MSTVFTALSRSLAASSAASHFASASSAQLAAAIATPRANSRANAPRELTRGDNHSTKSRRGRRRDAATARPRRGENADPTRSTFCSANTRDGHAALSAASPTRFRGPRSPLRRTAFSAGSADSAAGYEPRGGAPQRQSQLRELNATRSRELTPQSPRARTPRSLARSPCWRPT